ncbi:Bet1-like protein, partial [Cucurbita argyrosperma subsp. sororia]
MGVEFDLRENEWMKNKRIADWILRRTGRIPIERFEGSACFASLGDRGEAATGLAPIVIAGADAWAFAPRLHAEFILILIKEYTGLYKVKDIPVSNSRNPVYFILENRTGIHPPFTPRQRASDKREPENPDLLCALTFRTEDSETDPRNSSFRGGSSFYNGNAAPYRSREGLSTRTAAASDEIQLQIDPMQGDLDDEIVGLHSQVKRLRNIAHDIGTEAKFQHDFLDQLQMTLIKAQAGVKDNPGKSPSYHLLGGIHPGCVTCN